MYQLVEELDKYVLYLVKNQKEHLHVKCLNSFFWVQAAAAQVQLEYINSLGRLSLMRTSRNVGFIFDTTTSLLEHIHATCISAHFHLGPYVITATGHYVSQIIVVLLGNTAVSSNIFYSNSLLNGVTKTNLRKITKTSEFLGYDFNEND